MTSSRWSSLLIRAGIHAENALEYVQRRASNRLKPDKKLHVIAYRGFAARHENGWHGNLSGRVLLYRNSPIASAPHSTQESASASTHPGASDLWNNLRASYARFDTDELAGVDIEGEVQGVYANTITDEEGYFTLVFNSDQVVDESTLVVSINLPQHSHFQLDGHPVVVLPATEAQFGVISDIDDTILITEATSLLRMMRLTLLESSASRVAFAGVAEFYQALHANQNPFFYVSSSPWNLYEFLTDFMRLNGIVAGPLMLRDFGIDETKFIAGEHKDHKLLQIRTILDTYPDLDFVLSGDSGQDDPEIYTQIVQEYPEKICSIYIRDVSDNWRDRKVQSLIETCNGCGVDMLLVPNTLAAAIHASSASLIPDNAIVRISQATEQDTTTT